MSAAKAPQAQPIRIAAVDLGTVTMRLLVADVDEGSVRVVAKSSDIVEVGDELVATGRIGRSALERVDATAARYAAVLEECGWRDGRIARTVVLATEAARCAENADELTAVLASHGLALDVIDGGAEAELSFLGAAQSFSGDNVLVADVGGGSTELTLGDAPAAGPVVLHAHRSHPFGARVVTDRFLASDPPAKGELSRAGAWCAQQVAPFFAGLSRRGLAPSRLVAVAGTATTLVAVRERMAEYRDRNVHGAVLTLDQIDGLIGLLAGLSLDERRNLAGLQPKRAGVIVGGAVALREVVAASGLGECTVSTTALLYGIMRSTWLACRKQGHGSPSNRLP